MVFERNVAYDVRRTSITYDTSTCFGYKKAEKHSAINEYDSASSEVSVITDVLHTPIERHITLHNRLLTFWFYTNLTSADYYTSCFNYVNNSPVTIAGTVIPKRKGLIRDISVNQVNVFRMVEKEKETLDILKVNVSIEIEVERPLFMENIPLRGFYFKHPDTKKKTRIQFSSNPDIYLKDKSKYPNACHIWNGLGFYSEDRPDLNVSESVFLNKEGGILTDLKKIEYLKVYNHVETSWNGLGLPERIGSREETMRDV